MKNILTEWRIFLNELKFEGATTELTRQVIPYIKDHLDENEGKPNFEPGEDIGHLPLNIYFFKEDGELPKSVSDIGVTHIWYNIKGFPSGRLLEYDTFSVGGEFTPVDDDARIIKITVGLTKDFRITDMSKLLERLKSVTIHEITHAGQSPETWKKTGEDSEKAKKLKYSSIKALRHYFMSPGEIEAFARGIYKQARMAKRSWDPKIPFAKKVDDYIDENIALYTHPGVLSLPRTQYTKDEVIDFFSEEFRGAIMDYAREYFPSADTSSRPEDELDYLDDFGL